MPTQVGATMPQVIFKLLESKFSPPIINSTTTELQVAYLLGVQAVLKELRDNHVQP